MEKKLTYSYISETLVFFLVFFFLPQTSFGNDNCKTVAQGVSLALRPPPAERVSAHTCVPEN